MHYPTAFHITESSQVGEARRNATGLAASLGFSETKQGEIAIIVTEIGTNLIRHARNGELFVRPLEIDGILGLELTGIDSGPGMSSVSQCMQDGYSTAGTPGNGLGAITRLSNLLDIYTVPGEGTVLVSQIWASLPPARAASNSPANSIPDLVSHNLDIGVINRPKPGQAICGDSWGVEQRPDRSLVFVADGLGHGPDAAIASQDAVRAFRKHRARRPSEIIEAVHLALHGTRGAAAAVAEIDFQKQEVCFAGIGNIAGSIVSAQQTQNMVSHNGIVGHQLRKIQEFVYGWAHQSLLVMHSDGLSSRWHLSGYRGLTVRHPRLIAGVLYRDFQRQNDDTTVLVAAEHK